jgi:hypothetical protein
VEAAEAAEVRGPLDAKRTAAPFRIKRFVLENWYFEDILAGEKPTWERSGLPRMGACCTVEEENCGCQNLRG